MYNSYGHDPWSKLYRMEALRELSKQPQAKAGMTGRESGKPGQLALTMRTLLTLLRGS
jgi:hypothetical protein